MYNIMIALLISIDYFGSIHAQQDFATCLNNAIPDSSRVTLPGSPGYDTKKANWNTRVPAINPAAIIDAINAQEISYALLCAKNAGVPVVARSGNCNYEGMSLGGKDGALVVDVSFLNQISVNRSNRTVTVGAGTLLGPLQHTLSKQELALPTAVVASIGVGGHTLGGGWGLWSRQEGLLVDKVMEIEVVTPDGKILLVSDKVEPDLFWALRGAGASNFGIVTEFKYQAFTPGQHLGFAWDYSIRDAEVLARILKAILRVFQELDPNTTCQAPIYSGTATLRCNIMLPASESENTSDKLHAIKSKIKNDLDLDLESEETMASGSDYMSSWLFFSGDSPESLQSTARRTGGDQSFIKSHSGIFNIPPSPSVIQGLANILVKEQGYWGFMYSQGGAIGTKMEDTAYVHRKAVASFQFGVSDPDSVPWLTELYRFLRPHYSESEQNYADLDEPDWKSLYYGSNLERLIQIKSKYDPENLFRYPFSIPLNTPSV